VPAPPRRSDTLDLSQLLAVLQAVRDGDFSQRMPPDLQGLPGEVAGALNEIIARQETVCSELARGMRNLDQWGGHWPPLQIPGAAGAWAEPVDAFRQMAENLALQTRDISDTLASLHAGSLDARMPPADRGIASRGIAEHLNALAGRCQRFCAETSRLTREMGAEGGFGGRADLGEVSGDWQEAGENLTFMARNLTSQLRSISSVVEALASGGVPTRVNFDARGDMRAVMDRLNAAAERLHSFSSQVNDMSNAVGKWTLTAELQMEGAEGVWGEMVEGLNGMVERIARQVRESADTARAIANGDFSRKAEIDAVVLQHHGGGELRELAEILNHISDVQSSLVAEIIRVAHETGVEGKLGGQVEAKMLSGAWRELRDNVNRMVANLTNQVRDISHTVHSLAAGDLSRKVTAPARGELQELKITLNEMIDTLFSFALEVTRVTREISNDGILGCQAEVDGVRGTWLDLRDNVNWLAARLTQQLREINEVVHALSRGDFSRKMTGDARGEALELKLALNSLADQLTDLTSELSRVSREIGVEGRYGGQAGVRGVDGALKDLVDTFNHMAASVTMHVRLATAALTGIAMGNFQPRIGLTVRDETEELFDTINGLVDTLASFHAQVCTVAREEGLEERLASFCEWTRPDRDIRAVPSQRHVAWALENQGDEARRRGESARARELYLEAVALAREVGDERRILDLLESLTALTASEARSDKDRQRAGWLLGTVERLRESTGKRSWRRMIWNDLRTIQSDPLVEAARAEGRELSIDEALARLTSEP
jgi:methyl-accepting chemotaxis protein